MKDLKKNLLSISAVRPIGRVSEISKGTVQISGLTGVARIADRVVIYRNDNNHPSGEIVQISSDHVTVLVDGALDGIRRGDRAALTQNAQISPSDSWIGRVIDPNGNPLDGSPLIHGDEPKKIRSEPPAATRRGALGERITTGLAVFDTVLPIVRGQRVGLFAGSGVGKSNLIGQLACKMQTDVVVVALIGERGREVRHFIDEVLDEEGLSKSVIVAATSDQSPLLRRQCAWTAMTVAEHFRDRGKQVLLLMDSITRFAEAHREVAVASGEQPVLRGHPASTTHLITSLCERAGPGLDHHGNITAVFSVLVAGSDMEEPIADILRGVLDGHVVLDRKIAERGRFPAIDLLRSVSRSLPKAASDDENALILETRRLLGVYSRNEMMITAGLYSHGSDPQVDRAIKLWPEIDSFLGKTDCGPIERAFSLLANIIRNSVPSNKRSSNPMQG